MIVSTMINIVVGKKGKPVRPLQVMGYEDEVQTLGDGRPQTEQEKELAQKEISLRFRLMQAAQRRAGVK